MVEEETKKKISAWAQVRAMGYNFWISNASEAMERLAFFGVRAILPLYMFSPKSVLQLSMTEKGIIFGVWAWIQCLLPMVTGGYSDAYGYRKSLVVAFTLNFLGYILMANIIGLAGDSHALRFWIMMMAAMLVGMGTAVFKPPVQGAVAKALDESNSGLGFGIFYWVVNIGGFLAPMAAAWLRGDPVLNPTWSHVFYGAAIVTALNLAFCLILFREPERDPKAGEKSSAKVFIDTMKQLWHDQSMFRFLLVVSGFWFMFMQLWDLLPNFIDEWVDTTDVGAFLFSVLGEGAHGFVTASGAAKPEILINIDSFTIILFVIPLSWFFGRYKMMTSLVLGMIIGLIGFIGAGVTNVGLIAAFFIFVFAIGEIICSPKFSEYVGMTAPPDKKAQYMGYSNMPFAFGWGIGNFVSGPLYDAFSSKAELAKNYLVEHLNMTTAQVQALSPSDIIPTLAKRAGVSEHQAVDLLWKEYHPWIIWCILGLVGLVSIIGMIWNYKTSKK
ncbi:MAG: peptide MFS transporter [Deltaproteobacteria bacterium]|nr:peptide MFS transporter [Deltaproteobacteria bacterium]